MYFFLFYLTFFVFFTFSIPNCHYNTLNTKTVCVICLSNIYIIHYTKRTAIECLVKIISSNFRLKCFFLYFYSLSCPYTIATTVNSIVIVLFMNHVLYKLPGVSINEWRNCNLVISFLITYSFHVNEREKMLE